MGDGDKTGSVSAAVICLEPYCEREEKGFIFLFPITNLPPCLKTDAEWEKTKSDFSFHTLCVVFVTYLIPLMFHNKRVTVTVPSTGGTINLYATRAAKCLSGRWIIPILTVARSSEVLEISSPLSYTAPQRPSWQTAPAQRGSSSHLWTSWFGHDTN